MIFRLDISEIFQNGRFTATELDSDNKCNKTPGHFYVELSVSYLRHYKKKPDKQADKCIRETEDEHYEYTFESTFKNTENTPGHAAGVTTDSCRLRQ